MSRQKGILSKQRGILPNNFKAYIKDRAVKEI
ncbi:hypothetical protein NIES3275_42200 [Microchaete diplosiphon NIES-3275]|nr:hypothetical protein NIES3275_42200 [Microchaete diplosiphon NIES-3275]